MRIYSCNTVIIGSGAAGFNCADRLYSLGNQNIAIVTDGINRGTSRNTGSDKQTYYKLSLSGNDSDSIQQMAESYFAGQCMDGDLALCEAALSVQCFLKLVELGVPFPRNRYGEYIGYKTDHDPRRRATSVGPYTSKRMTECLERSVREKEIPIYDGFQAIKVLKNGERAVGLLCLDTAPRAEKENRFVGFCCENLVFATGGPAGMYADSVYPESQLGASGLAFEAGVKGKNLTEWQYGLSSVAPRWNVSGTYMQVLPRFVSTEPDGSDPKEFLFDFFQDTSDLLTKVFLKGYQWPFDVRKVAKGSSIIDILVYLESCKGRRVYLDFRTNPRDEEIDYSALSEEVKSYLEKAGACFGTPIDRLARMNQPAIDFYLEHGVDLRREMLEIALGAQHNNGGLDVNCWWETNVPHLFAAGEAAGSHGVYRPGGSALNAGQVGSTRAAQYIAEYYREEPKPDELFTRILQGALLEAEVLAGAVLKPEGKKSNIKALWQEASADMSRNGAAFRNQKDLQAFLERTQQRLERLCEDVVILNETELGLVFRYRDMLISQLMYGNAMLDYIRQHGKSRGSALYTDPKGSKPYEMLPETFTYLLDDGGKGDMVQEVSWEEGRIQCDWRKVRPIPQEDDFFENIWREYRRHKNVY